MTDEFNAERAKDSTLETIWITTETVRANADLLIPKIVDQFGAPSEDHAKHAILMTLNVLTLLAQHIEASSPDQIHDATDMLEAIRVAATKKAH